MNSMDTTSPDAFNRVCATCRRVLDVVQNVRWHTDLVHHESLESLHKSAKAACGICTNLLDQIQNSNPQSLEAWSGLFPIICECDTSSASWQSSFDMRFRADGRGPFSLKFTFDAVQVSGEQHNPVQSTDSPQNWTLIDKWLQYCTQNHIRCNAPPPQPWTPSRLLEISSYNDGFVRLVERDENHLHDRTYATLSHCWGKSQPIQTSRQNIEDHRRSISTQKLPKTFQDAIRIAATLKIQYLWVDSLCIVQDSLDDWDHEAGEMSKVYRYGFINIAATGAAHGAEGCFWERDPRTVRPTRFDIHWSRAPDDEVRSYQVVPDADLWARKFVSEPLLQRGWVFQERILSSRMLHFGQEQLFWECRESVACETYPQGLPASLRQNTLIDIKTLDLGDEPKDSRWPARYVSAGFKPRPNYVDRMTTAIKHKFKPVTLHQVTLKTQVSRPSIYRDWDAAVELYSLGALSYDKDKLVALSGLADAISIGDKSLIEDGYLAGLWQSSLPSHLLWTTETVTTKRNRENITLAPRQIEAVYIAPSWSWASINGKISFKWCQYNYDPKDYLAQLEFAEVSWSPRKTIFGRFGHLEHGSLCLEAPLASALWYSSKFAASSMPASVTHVWPSEMEQNNSIDLITGSRQRPTTIYFDTPSCSDLKVLTLLPVLGITKRTVQDNEMVCGLVLRKLEGTDEYVRLGIFHSAQERACRILRNMPRQTVTIV